MLELQPIKRQISPWLHLIQPLTTDNSHDLCCTCNFYWFVSSLMASLQLQLQYLLPSELLWRFFTTIFMLSTIFVLQLVQTPGTPPLVFLPDSALQEGAGSSSALPFFYKFHRSSTKNSAHYRRIKQCNLVESRLNLLQSNLVLIHVLAIFVWPVTNSPKSLFLHLTIGWESLILLPKEWSHSTNALKLPHATDRAWC